jgi:hypothetical protein
MSEIIIYQSDTNEIQVEVQLENDSLWLTQTQLVEMLGSSKANISEHIKHIFESGELAISQPFGNPEQFNKKATVKLKEKDCIII